MISDSPELLDRLQRLRRFEGGPREFWAELISALLDACGAQRAYALTRLATEEGGAWQLLAVSGDGAGVKQLRPEHFAAAESAAREGVGGRSGAGPRIGAVMLKTGDASRAVVLVLEFSPEFETAEMQGQLRVAQLVADIPESYQTFRQLTQSRADLTDFANTLDLLALLRGRERFLEAAFTACGELATRHRCTQVALGWLEGRYARLQALSHRENFEKRMDVVQRIESAMEEAVDQDDEIVWPAADALRVTRDHERCAAAVGARYLATVPLRLNNRSLGALLFQRETAAFTSAELRAMRVTADQITEPLALLRRRDRWWGARLKGDAEDWLRTNWSLEHPWVKLGAIGMTLLLGIALLGRTTYRVEATFILRPEEQALIGAAFDGYLKSVAVSPGDGVAAGAELFSLDDAPLRIQEASLRADVSRFRAEAERARGEGRMAEMRVAQAQEQQSAADLEFVRHQLAGAVHRAPFAGLVIDDADMRERLGAPVKRGDLLLKLAKTDRRYAELNVPESDIDHIRRGATGEIAFASRPENSQAIRIERVEPVAVARDGGGVFLVRATFVGPPPEWARPGMTGLAKIDAGRRTWFWIGTHRLVDWLRLKLWW